MKILHVIWTLGMGGIERLVLDLCVQQMKAGQDPSILVGQNVGALKPLFEAANIPIISANMARGLSPVGSARPKVIAALQDTDIAHFHAYNPVFAKLAKASQKPIIYTDHGNNALGRRKKPVEHIMFPLRDKFMSRGVDFLTFNSKFTQKQASLRMSLDRVQNDVVYNGIDLITPEPDTLTVKADLPFNTNDYFIVGTTSRFAGFKRIDRLIEAFANLNDIANCKLLLVGDGGLRPEYERLVAEKNLSDHVVFTGYQSPIFPYQKVMDVCVFPSEGEPFGLVALETYALGKPTLVMSDGGGILEIIEAVEPKDIVSSIEALSARILDYKKDWEAGILLNPKKIMARQARAQSFTVSKMAKEFMDIYMTVSRRP